LQGLRDSGGLFGVARHAEAAHRTYLGLHALQHRGSRSAGLAVADGQFIRCVRGWGMVADAIGGPQLQALAGTTAIGQVHGGPEADGLEGGDGVVFSRYRGGQLAVALTGRFTNGPQLRRELKEHGALFQSDGDAEILAHLVAHSSQRTEINRLVDALWKVDGGWSALVCMADRMVAVRGPRGFRPMWMGRNEEAVWFSTEEAAIRFAGGTPERELQPGEVAIVDAHGVHCVSPFARRRQTSCVQEFITLARGDGRVFGHETWSIRSGLGERLAKEAPSPRASVVIGTPGAGEALASGYGRVARIPAEAGLVHANLGGRQIEEPPSGVRNFGSLLRWSVVPGAVAERSVALIVPVVVPGDDTARIVEMLRQAGATEVHLRVASPPLNTACAYGVTTPGGDAFVTEVNAAGGLTQALGVDTFDTLSLDGLHAVVGRRVDDTTLYCDACLSGNHPVPPEPEDDQLPLF
jgi:amidophosphoribosyltransferase